MATTVTASSTTLTVDPSQLSVAVAFDGTQTTQVSLDPVSERNDKASTIIAASTVIGFLFVGLICLTPFAFAKFSYAARCDRRTVIPQDYTLSTRQKRQQALQRMEQSGKHKGTSPQSSFRWPEIDEERFRYRRRRRGHTGVTRP